MNTPHTANRVKMADKRVYGGKTDVNQLVPFKYSGVWDGYIKANERHWMPTQFDFAKERELITSDPGLLSCMTDFIGLLSVSATMFPTLGVAIYGAFSSPEHRQYMLRLNFEESVHGHLAMTLAESLGVSIDKCHNDFLDKPGVSAWLKIRSAAYESIMQSQTTNDAKGFVIGMINATTQAWVFEQNYALPALLAAIGEGADNYSEVIKRYSLDKKTHMSFFIGSIATVIQEERLNASDIEGMRDDSAYMEYKKLSPIFIESVSNSYHSVLNALFSKGVNTFQTAFEKAGGSLVINQAESTDTSSTSAQTATTGQLEW